MVSTRLMTISTGPCNSEENSLTNTASTSSQPTRNTTITGPQSLSNVVSLASNSLVTISGGGGFHIIDGGSSSMSNTVPQHQQLLLLDLPIEILDKIFSYVGYKKTAQLRVVSFFFFKYHIPNFFRVVSIFENLKVNYGVRERLFACCYQAIFCQVKQIL